MIMIDKLEIVAVHVRYEVAGASISHDMADSISFHHKSYQNTFSLLSLCIIG